MTVLSPQAFEDEVLAQGGRVDYVFGDDRPFAECHASTLVEAANGDFLCSWFGGTKEGNPDVGIWLSRLSGGRWSAPTQVAKISQTAHWNPVLFRDPAHGMFLFFKVGPEVAPWQTYWMRSDHDGATWSPPVELVPGDIGGRGPVKNKPIILSDGAWLAPASTELNKEWKPFADRSEDGGATWTRSDSFGHDPAIIKGGGAIQPTFWESQPGHVHALMRTTGGVIARADSTDGGRTWTAMSATSLPNNNSGFDAVRLADGRVFLIYNPIGEDWGPRTPIDLAVSTDNGLTWRTLAHLETAEGEYSYPGIVAAGDGVALCYTWKRERIRWWRIPDSAF